MRGRAWHSAGKRMRLSTLVPPAFRIPARYYFHRLTGRVEPELAWVRRFVRTRGVAVDVGSFNGEYALALARCSEIVHCFEPQKPLADALQRYPSRRIKVHNVALSDAEGTLELSIPVSGGSAQGALATLRKVDGEHRKERVPVRRLDDYDLTNVTFIKIDVEGFEKHVVEGARRTIEKYRPALLVEIEARHLDTVGLEIAEVFHHILAFGYYGYFLRDGQLAELANFDVREDQLRLGDDVNRTDYINNFFFLPDPCGRYWQPE